VESVSGVAPDVVVVVLPLAAEAGWTDLFLLPVLPAIAATMMTSATTTAATTAKRIFDRPGLLPGP
jgi:hypothetical protein